MFKCNHEVVDFKEVLIKSERKYNIFAGKYWGISATVEGLCVKCNCFVRVVEYTESYYLYSEFSKREKQACGPEKGDL